MANNKKQVIKLTKLKQTCFFCPSQWEGITDDKRPVYIRYRWGYLSVRLGIKNKGIADAVKGKEIFGKSLGNNLDGFLKTKDMLKAAKETIISPTRFKPNGPMRERNKKVNKKSKKRT